MEQRKTSTGATGRGQPRKRFVIHHMAAEPPPRVPRVRELQDRPPQPIEPPEHIVAKLGDAKVVVAVDLETHDWDSSVSAKGLIGQFGHYTFRDEQVLSYARIAQLGWVIGDADATSTPWISKEYEILPIDFKISPKATQYHKITNEHAMSNGRHLRDVLEEFMHDMIHAHEAGGRVVAHQLEFDAGIINNELERLGLHKLKKLWREIARKGVCTMSPAIGRWLRSSQGQDTGSEVTKNTMGLMELVRWLVPVSEYLARQHHAAGADSQMHRLLYIALVNRCKGSTVQRDEAD